MTDRPAPPPDSIPVALFPLGQINGTRGVFASIPPDEVLLALARHVRGDWGELDDHDRNANDSALQNGGRLVSVYRLASGVRFYVITEWDRSQTTVLLPSEY